MSCSEAQAAANKKNAQKSTGPKTPEGKKRSSRNALKHGLTSAAPLLPDDDRAVHDTRMQEYLDYFRPADPSERDVIEQVVAAKSRLERCARAENARIANRFNHAAADHRRGRFASAVGLIRKLLDDPINRFKPPQDFVPHVREAIDEYKANDPAVLVDELESTLEGVDLMLGAWKGLDAMLEFHGYWHYPEKFQAVRLLGKRPCDACEDHAVADVFLASNTIHPADWTLFDDFHQGRIGFENKPNFMHQIKKIEELRLDQDDSQSRLFFIIEEQVERLTKLRERLAPQAELDVHGAVTASLFDDSKEAQLIRRYETACEREFHRGVKLLQAMKKERQKSGEWDAPAPDGESEAPEMPNEPTPEVEPEPAVTAAVKPTPVPGSPLREPRLPDEHKPTHTLDFTVGIAPKNPPGRPR